MKKLNIPNLNSETVYNEILERSTDNDKKLKLNEIKNTVFERYEDYDFNKNHLEHLDISPITDTTEKEYLKKNYKRNKLGYLEGHVVTEILRVQSVQLRNTCPYCGIDKPRTIDHYLPRSKFPEYSIYPNNLVPCCGYCNSKKSNDWLNDGKRQFINYYYDELPYDKIYLKANINYSNNIPLITFEIIANNIESNEHELITSHYTNLDLLEEYREIIEEEVSNIRHTIQCAPQLSTKEHIFNLEMSLKTFEVKYGVNYWKAVLYRALVVSEEFIMTFV